MTPGEKPYICYRGMKYRDIEHRLENTYREGDCARVVDEEQKKPMVEDSEAKQFGEALLKSVQDLARQIEVMGQRFTVVEARQHETPRGFHVGEGSGTSHHLPERDATPHQASHAPTRSTMPTFLGADTGAGVQHEPEPGHMGDYFAEYQAYGKEFKDALSFRDFVQLQRDSRSRDHHRGHRHCFRQLLSTLETA